MAINRTSPKKGKVVDIPDAAVTIGTATAGDQSASIAFTATSPATGGPVQKYTAVSNPGSFTGNASASPVVVSGLTNGTAYTFTVAAANATGAGVYSSASNSATPFLATAYESIATITSAATTVTFSSIPSTYKHLQLRVFGKNSNTTYSSLFWNMQFNGDTGANYNCQSLYGDGSTPYTMYNGTYTNSMIAGVIVGTNGSAAQNSSPMIVDILDYTSTSKNKVIRSLSGWDNNGSGEIRLASGLWLNTAAINSISLIGGDSHISAALYGIKG